MLKIKAQMEAIKFCQDRTDKQGVENCCTDCPQKGTLGCPVKWEPKIVTAGVYNFIPEA